MIVLTTSTDTQEFKFIPRDMELTGVSPRVTDDITLVDATLDAYQFSINGDYVRAQVDFANLKEDRFYTLRIEKEGVGVIYKDKVFVTDQTIEQTEGDVYTINEEEYIEQETSSNDYIVI